MKRALIIEDDPIWTGILRLYVERENLDVVSVNSPQAAMDACDEQKPDLIILDMLLAAETGMALLNEMLGYDDLANIPVVVCSSVGDIELNQLSPFGVRAVFDKSKMRPEDFGLALRKICHE